MAPVSHTRSALTVAALLASATRRLRRARLHYGHGTASAADDAAALLWHVMAFEGRATPARLRRRVSTARRAQFETLLRRRVAERVPAVYLTGLTWFAGVPIRTDPRALIPRSPLAELIERGFAPWVEPRRIRRVLDLGTGSGCIALACALHLPRARVDGVDVSESALALARENRRALRLARRVRLLRSNHFSALRGRRYDIIVSNPPYVGEREFATLPREYRHEPRLGLAAGRDGLDSVRVILREAPRHLEDGGVLIVEVGNSEEAVRREWPRLPFTWVQFERGGGGVFLLRREQLIDPRIGARGRGGADVR